MDGPRHDLRRKALLKIATLSASSPSYQVEQSGLGRLSRTIPGKRVTLQKPQNGSMEEHSRRKASLSKAPMTIEELHALLALCKASPQIGNLRSAERLLGQLSPYLLEAHDQTIAPSPFLHLIEPSPWEALSHNLVAAILVLGIRYPPLHDNVYGTIIRYLQECAKASRVAAAVHAHYNGIVEDMEPQKSLDIGAISISMLGFLEAASTYFYFFDVTERLEVVTILRETLSESFMVLIEGACSAIRTSESPLKLAKDFKYYAKRYASSGRPLGAMLLQRAFLRMLVSCSSLQIVTAEALQQTDIFDYLTSKKEPHNGARGEDAAALTEMLSDIAAEEMHLLEDGADYLQLGSAWQQRLAFSVKGHALTIFLACMVVDEEIAEVDVLMSWLDDTMADAVEMADDDLACIVLKSLAIAAKMSPAIASILGRSLPRFIVQGGIRGPTVVVAAECLAYILQLISLDAVITGLYSLGNVLSIGSSTDKGLASAGSAESSLGFAKIGSHYAHQATGSAISLDISGVEETSAVYGNVVRAVVSIACTCNDHKITPLALSMLVQKFGRISMVVDLQIVVESAMLAAVGSEVELKSLLKLYDKFSHDALVQNNVMLLDAVMKARVNLARNLSSGSTLFHVYLSHVLGTIVSKGDVHESESTHQAEVDLAAQEIGQLLKPLAILMASSPNNTNDEDVTRLQRDAWFNIAVHGITPGSSFWQRHLEDLRIMAIHSEPLIAEDRVDHFESDIDLNTVLRRGMNVPHTSEMKRRLTKLLVSQEANIRALTYPRVMFLHAAYLLETLRADSGNCTDILLYFADSSLNKDEMGVCMVAVAEAVLGIYLKSSLSGRDADSSAPYVARQLAKSLTTCCHRIPKCQQVATVFCDRLIGQLPSSLCQRNSLFALLELLTLMWSSCLEAEIDEYEWKSTYVSTLVNVSLVLSDDFDLRRRTLSSFYKRARTWVMMVMNVAPIDIKGLLQTYLSEYNDNGAYGHVALGRSFALEMGSAIPLADQRLAAIDRHSDCNINTGSDFIAQYTTRQEYRYADALPEYDQDWVKLLQSNEQYHQAKDGSDHDIEDANAILTVLEHRVIDRKFISISELRDILRRAAALLCRSKHDQCAIVHHLVRVPFTQFNKQSIKLGISLWLGVINENPRMEPRIIVEIAEHWIETVQRQVGIFDQKFHHLDPFYIKEEFAPSDKAALLKRQQFTHDLITPHLRILYFFASHFNAYRLGSPYLRKIFQRLIKITLQGLRKSTGHPLAREFHFQVISFGLTILRFSDDLGESAKWRLKDGLLSAALAWFAHPQRWSFGGNRLQIKTESHLMADLETSLSATASISSIASKNLQSLTAKQDLLIRLLENEHTRLQVWLFPVATERRHRFSSNRVENTLGAITPLLLRTAWTEGASLAIQLALRSQSPLVRQDLRSLLLNHPEKALEEPEALQILLDNGIPTDISTQLRFLLYWASVNPVTAVTYFRPGYANHPFVLQYAMRALESHSVDVTFFYVPQIVQTLRYDSLGYVQRYIIETAKFSQLFAHQIIWNMKANAYKDEDSTIEDGIKPTLDKVMTNMIASFSVIDKAFYEKEFSFFNEITDISGKLRPYIKREKAEKKQKIEEELRKIKVEVGVYLPSNPEGVVIGIDRKSGKPLQSHAKAPYMATFRIRKNKGDIEDTDKMLEQAAQSEQTDASQVTAHESTYEVWQSAIFKVGDDCRQDVLALQMIAAFRGIFNSVGLDVYVYPYRVTATAPGCGVIDVLPNSISRDMLGREAVNGLYDYFVSKYGGEESIRFQEARSNFVKSMAAYSVISYLLQFKDRHNGNIMIDDAGHILHIDFGFCFDIAPGGMRFENAPFKLTSEMVAVMGGSTNSQSYKWFQELCIKAFLASRPYTEKLCHMVVLMLDSGLPCFKPESMTNFRQRFVLERSEREAADFMKELIKKSYKSYSTHLYDEFQLLTNGIPF